MQDSDSHITDGVNESEDLVGFEYSGKKDETPFETFLRYTDEKHKSATQLSVILQDRLTRGVDILDVGAGNGEYLHLALAKIKSPEDITLTLVEPSDNYVAQLSTRYSDLSGIKVKTVHSTLEDFSSDQKFDAILMSHMLSRSSWNEQLTKGLSLLKPNGALIIVLRGKDDVYTFKMRFKPLLFGEAYKALIIDDVLEKLSSDNRFKVSKHPVPSELRVPFREDIDDTKAVIEFYLNKRWVDIPASVQQEVLRYIADKKGRLSQLDCIAVIERHDT